ncbi:piggyBac transposable element-derived protein 4-like [Eleutherodactylus coqui]|uniref:piggyBac transposable element-derived protein 4-like n=1 Tax=Eleutherodactylus coqui TaxID=57060 RepID=UPI00346256E9
MSRRLYSAEEAYAILCSDSDSETETDAFSDTLFLVSDSDSSSANSCSAASINPQVELAGPSSAAAQEMPVPPIEVASLVWTPTTSFTPKIVDFTAIPGINLDVTNFSFMDYFSLFISEELLTDMVRKTNLHARQYIAQHPSSTHTKNWKPTTLYEFKKFLGLTLNMGIVKKPTIRSYWASSPTHATPVFSAVMPRHRYEEILRFLHFNDNLQALPRTDPNYDRLFKIRPLMTYFNEIFKTHYTPEKNLSIDESLMSFKGRLRFRQYIPTKRARYGVKLYKLCESETGYTTTFRIYEGRDSKINPPRCPPNLSISGKIVWELIQPFLHKGYHLYTDNFYTSVPLFKLLHTSSTGACGTIRKNKKGFPQRLVGKQIPKGTSVFFHSDELLAVIFRDRKDVFALSTIHTNATEAVRERGSASDKQKPECIINYNKFMGGVDLADQVLQPYLVK